MKICDFLVSVVSLQKYKTPKTLDFTQVSGKVLASQKGFEPPTFRLGKATEGYFIIP